MGALGTFFCHALHSCFKPRGSSPMTDVLRKDQLEKSLFEENKLIRDGELKEDNPRDSSPAFLLLCDASRRGDLKVCQEALQDGANINASDEFDYTPLILASLCGHYEVVELLLESGALCERDTFQGERCLYNALNDRIRNLLLSYDYSKSTDPLQPYAAHVYSLFSRNAPPTSDYFIEARGHTFAVHRFVLASRSPYFHRKFRETTETKSWVLPDKVPMPSLDIALKYLYLGELPRDIGSGYGSDVEEEQILKGLDRLSRLFEIENLMQKFVERGDRKAQRQQRQAEVAQGRTEIESWFKEHVLTHKFEIDKRKVGQVKWSKDNAIFADVLLYAYDEHSDELTPPHSGHATPAPEAAASSIPVGPTELSNTGAPSPASDEFKVTLFPVHKAMLIRAEFFLSMFSSRFVEAQNSECLRTVRVSCSPAVLENILIFLYGERADFSLQVAVEVLFAADMLLMERLKAKAAVVINSLGNGVMTTKHPQATPRIDPFLPAGSGAESKGPGNEHEQSEEDPLDPYMTLRAAWDLRVPRLETFAARYFAYRLEKYIDEDDFVEIIRESAERIQGRQETDSIELIDDIRYYLSERFRLRFEGEGIEELLNDESSKARNGHETADEGDASDDDTIFEEKVNESTKGMTDVAPDEEIRKADALEAVSRATDDQNTELLWAEKQVVRTLDGNEVGDEFAADALNYEMLMGKIDTLLENLNLDA